MSEAATILGVWLAASLLAAITWSYVATRAKRRQPLTVADLDDEQLHMVHESARFLVARTHMEQQRRQRVRDAEIAALEQQWRQS